MKKQTPRLQNVTVLPDLVVSVTFTDGRTATVSMRDVIKNCTGARPVPRVVALACKGWNSENMKNAA